MHTLQTILEGFLPLETMLRMLVAIGAAAVVGLEREQREKPAGLRTHILVSLGAAVFMIGAIEMSVAAEASGSMTHIDPMRALAGIIGGVGFLGAGAIVQSRGGVRGITTAASIWISAAIGTCCGMGLYRLAITCGVMSVIVLWGLGFIEKFVFANDPDAPK